MTKKIPQTISEGMGVQCKEFQKSVCTRIIQGYLFKKQNPTLNQVNWIFWECTLSGTTPQETTVNENIASTEVRLQSS